MKQAGQVCPVPDVPDGGEYLWRWFWKLSRARSNVGFGQGPLTYSEIEAWSRLTGANPDEFEVRTIMAMDAVYLGGKAENVQW